MKGRWQEKSKVQAKGNKETPQQAVKMLRRRRLEKSVADTKDMANTNSISEDLYKLKQVILAPSFSCYLMKEQQIKRNHLAK